MKEGMMEVDIKEYIELKMAKNKYDYFKSAIREDMFSSIDTLKEYLRVEDKFERSGNADS